MVLASKENHTWMVEEELMRSMEDLEDVELVGGDPSKSTKLGGELQLVVKEKIVKFLKNNLDVFAWSHKDMLGIDGCVIEHPSQCQSKEEARPTKATSICSRTK